MMKGVVSAAASLPNHVWSVDDDNKAGSDFLFQGLRTFPFPSAHLIRNSLWLGMVVHALNFSIQGKTKMISDFKSRLVYILNYKPVKTT